MNKKDIIKIVDELIALEPSLKEHRVMFTEQITSIVSTKPDTKFTERFKKKLLSELRTHLVSAPSSSLSLSQTMNKWFYALGGAAVASFALYVTVIHPVVPVPSIGDDHDGYMDEGNLPPAMDRMMNTQMPEMAMDSNEPAPMPTRPQSGGGGDSTMMGYGRGGGGGGMMDSKMIAPGEPYGYAMTEYVYDGEIGLPKSKTMTAYKRAPLKGAQKADLLTGTFVDGMMNIDKLKSLSVTNVSLLENGDEPMAVSVDFTDGSIGMNRQMDYSKNPASQCRDQQCMERYRLKKADMLSDDRVISIASSFLKDLGVDLGTYGEPAVQDDWNVRYEMAPDKTNFYFPEQVSVTFPYLVDDLPVFDEWGNPQGVSVNVDVRLRAAVGMWGMRTMNLSPVMYTTPTDTQTIRDLIRTGGMNGYIPQDAKTQQATLAEPKMVYVSQYEWNEKTLEGYEVYVPALAFPVLKMPEGSYEYRKAIVVPLAQELLDKKKEQMPPVPMPLVDPAVMEKQVMDDMPLPPDTMMKNDTMMEEGEAG